MFIFNSTVKYRYIEKEFKAALTYRFFVAIYRPDSKFAVNPLR